MISRTQKTVIGERIVPQCSNEDKDPALCRDKGYLSFCKRRKIRCVVGMSTIGLETSGHRLSMDSRSMPNNLSMYTQFTNEKHAHFDSKLSGFRRCKQTFQRYLTDYSSISGGTTNPNQLVGLLVSFCIYWPVVS